MSSLGKSLEVDHKTIRFYLDILTDFYMVRQLQPWAGNTKKRLVKSPKVYLRDSGILHTLLEIEGFDDLLSHPSNGASWEGYSMENILAAMPRHRPSFVRTSNGAEIDLVMEYGTSREVFEFKLSKSPKPSRGFHELVKEIGPEKSWIVAPVDEPYEYAANIMVASPADFSPPR